MVCGWHCVDPRFTASGMSLDGISLAAALPAVRVASDKEKVRMLVLSRKQGESIRIGDDILLTVVQIRRNQVRIGIEAPGEVPVFREEILVRDEDWQEANQPTVKEPAAV